MFLNNHNRNQDSAWIDGVELAQLKIQEKHIKDQRNDIEKRKKILKRKSKPAINWLDDYSKLSKLDDSDQSNQNLQEDFEE